MEKNIVEVVVNTDGTQEKVADYIGVEKFADVVYKLYQGCLNDYEGEGGFIAYLEEIYSDVDAMLKIFATDFAYKANRDMKKYLHMSSHKLIGNFADIAQDYPVYRTGCRCSLDYDGNDYHNLFPEMVKRLDAAEDSARADEDRKILSDWFFEAFGTNNITYNFSTELSELHYQMEKEQEEDTLTARQSILNRLTHAVHGTDKEFFSEEELDRFASFYEDKWDENTSEDVIAEAFTDYWWDNEKQCRRCSECGKLMVAGYCVDMGEAYYCSEQCLYTQFGNEAGWLEECKNNDQSYYTEWRTNYKH